MADSNKKKSSNLSKVKLPYSEQPPTSEWELEANAERAAYLSPDNSYRLPEPDLIPLDTVEEPDGSIVKGAKGIGRSLTQAVKSAYNAKLPSRDQLYVDPYESSEDRRDRLEARNHPMATTSPDEEKALQRADKPAQSLDSVERAPEAGAGAGRRDLGLENILAFKAAADKKAGIQAEMDRKRNDADMRKKYGYEEPIKVGGLDPYAAPDTSAIREEYARDKAEKRKDYEDQRSTNAWSELAQKIGSGLARYGAAQEGARKGISIGKVDTGADIDYSDRTKMAYKDYVDELADLQTLRRDREKEVLSGSAAEYQSRLDALRQRATEAQKILDRNLERDKLQQRDREYADTIALRAAAVDREQGIRSDLEREKLAERIRQNTMNSLDKEAARLQGLITGLEKGTTNEAAIIKSEGMNDIDRWYGMSTSPDKNEIGTALGQRVAALKDKMERIRSGEIQPQIPSTSSTAPTEDVTVRIKATGEAKKMSKEEAARLMNGPTASQLEIVK